MKKPEGSKARLHEELALREEALRDTRIRTIHVMEALKRAHEMRTGAHFADTRVARKDELYE